MLDSGPMLLIAWAVGGLFALAGAFTYAELATSFPHPGGDYRFLREAFGPGAAFLFAWSRFSVIFTASGALLAFVAADYLAQIVPLSEPGKAGVAALAVVMLTAVNLRGLRFGAGGQAVLVTLDILALLSLGAAAVWLIAHGTPSLTPMMTAAAKAGALQPLSPAALGRFGAAMVFIMLAYGGFNDAATLSAEVKGPRDMTLAMVGGMSRIDRDVPPFSVVEGHPGRVRGLNRIGIKRSGLAAKEGGAEARQLQEVWSQLYRSDRVLAEALVAVQAQELLPAAQELCDFLRASISPGRRGPLPAQRP
jgi:amino acid transporter